MRTLPIFFTVALVLLLTACKEVRTTAPPLEESPQDAVIEYASGLEIEPYGDFTIVKVKEPWPDAQSSLTYLLYRKGADVPQNMKFDAKIQIPVQNVVVTSTTHIPSLEALDELQALTGFPGLQYISSSAARARIAAGKVAELGSNEALQTETLLNLHPDAVVTFSIDGSNKSLETISRSGIPVIYNADWTEATPLGKAEWIKFFGALFGKLEEARALFATVEKNYQQAKELAQHAEERPTVLAGSMYKDQWFLPAGDSWNAQFFEDANAAYLFEAQQGTGSLSLSLETVLAEAATADFWIGPAEFTSYEQMLAASPHYAQFEAFAQRDIYTFSSAKGSTGGVLFYELAPNRPDLVLLDLISIFHPELLPDHELHFYKPLQ